MTVLGFRREVLILDVLKISESKLKIMLSRADMKKYKLDIENVDYNDIKTRNKVWEILDYVKKQHGFNHEGEKLLIQFYPSKDGGAELFVTKLENLSHKNERSISRANNVTMLDTKRTMYSFGCFDDLVRASKIIKESKCIKGSELFYDGNEGYYLEIIERGASRYGSICDFAILLEFSSAVPKELYPYINEHCSKLTRGNAVEQLARL